MSIRAVSSELYTNLLSALAQDRQNVNQAVEESSTGQSVNAPSDNPLAVGQLIMNRAQLDAVDQFTTSVSTVQGFLQTADSALNSVVQSLTQAVSLGTEGGNGTLSSDERTTIAQQVTAIQQQIVGLANTTYQGNYLFAGTAVKTQPYAVDSSAPSGVSEYAGNEEINTVEVGEGQSVSTNVPGSAIFSAQGADVFQSLSDLSTAIQNNGDVSSALAEVQNTLNNVTEQRTSYGDTLQELNSANFNLNQESLTLQQIQTGLISVDPAKAATDLTQAQTTLEASLAAGSEISQDSLFKYLQ
jgi:flagellar hook-associated protein 3 FlgL